jgi:tRNA pseudouridine55 synthase
MALRYRRHDLHGLLVIDKPPGISSMEVVRRVRRSGGHCKTGHAGTLDPLATGVLICCLGRATKRVDQLMGLTKVYDATIDLSAFTSTDDAEGEREPVELARPPAPGAVRAALDRHTGDIAQRPPAYSAIKVGGRRAYKLARAGDAVELAPRTVRIESIDLHRYDWPRLEITVTCGKGTYIRALARQLGQALGTGGYLAALRRTAIGPYTIEHAWPLDALPQPINPEHLIEVDTP